MMIVVSKHELRREVLYATSIRAAAYPRCVVIPYLVCFYAFLVRNEARDTAADLAAGDSNLPSEIAGSSSERSLSRKARMVAIRRGDASGLIRSVAGRVRA